MIRIHHHVNTNPRSTVNSEEYSILRATYEVILRMLVQHAAAIKASVDALDAAHNRLRTANQQLQNKLGLNTFQ